MVKIGRYYSGDIDGKFWFGVQSSDDANFFGVKGEHPEELEYYFDKKNLKDIKKGVKICLKELGTFKRKFDTFFKTNNGYNNKMLIDKFNLSKEGVKILLGWYARLELGNKILKCVKDEDSCSFTAEC